MRQQVLVVGGGIGGLAASLACSRAGAQVQLFEQAASFSEVGAGVQLGPNAVRLLESWGLGRGLSKVAAYPSRLEVRAAGSGRNLGRMQLGARMHQRYGEAYVTVHRADLHRLLLDAVRLGTGVDLQLGSQIEQLSQDRTGVRLQTQAGLQVQGDLLVGADGVHSRVRESLLQDGSARETGHLAYRALLPQMGLPPGLRSQHITLWLAPGFHVVQYPVRGGEWLNLVVLVARQPHPSRGLGSELWEQWASASDLHAVVGQSCTLLAELLQVSADWGCWALRDRIPLRGPHEMAGGRLALLGDAAHPMLPYLAQGAGMALEDGQALGQALTRSQGNGVAAWQDYAQQRWQRNARVQARARRNANIFHATGLLRWGRDLSMGLLGERLLDWPWLYQGPQWRGTDQAGA